MLAAVYWARVPRVVLPDRALCLPTFCHSLLTVNKSSSSSSLSLSHHGQRGRHSYELSDIQAHLLIHDFPADKRPTQVVFIRHRYYAGK